MDRLFRWHLAGVQSISPTKVFWYLVIPFLAIWLGVTGFPGAVLVYACWCFRIGGLGNALPDSKGNKGTHCHVIAQVLRSVRSPPSNPSETSHACLLFYVEGFLAVRRKT